MFTVNIQNQAIASIRDLQSSLVQPGALAEIAGRSGSNTVKSWLRTLNSARANRFGGARTNFFAKAAAATGFETSDTGATIYSETVGVLYQRYGGVIKPSGRTSSVTGKPITRLAIPARAEAHGKLPSDFNDLSFWTDGKGHMGLVQNDSQQVSFGPRRKDGSRKAKQGKSRGGLIMFWLVRQASKGPDEGVLPSESLVSDAVSLALLDYTNRALAGGRRS
jgi:hypothetical protein